MLGAADTGTDPNIHLGLHNPAAHRLHTQPFPSRENPRQLGRRRILRAMLGNHPHHPLTYRGLNLLRHLHILLNSERCGMKPRAVQSRHTPTLGTHPATTAAPLNLSFLSV